MPVMSSHCNQTLPALSRFYTDIENNFDDTGQSCGGSNLYSRCFHNPDASMSVFSVSKSSQILRVPFCKPFSSAEMPPPETDITLSDSDSNHSIDVSSNTSNTHNFSCLVSVAKSNSDTDIDTNVPKDDEMLRDSCEANSSPGAKKETHSNRVGSCDATRSDSNQHSAGLGNIMDADCGFLAAFQIDDFTEIFDRAAISLSRISETPQWLIDAGTVLGTFDTILSVCNRLAYDYVHYTMQFLKQLPIFNELTTREKVDLLGNSVSGVMLTMMSDGYRKKRFVKPID